MHTKEEEFLVFKETLKDGATLYMGASTVRMKCGKHRNILTSVFIPSYVPCTIQWLYFSYIFFLI